MHNKYIIHYNYVCIPLLQAIKKYGTHTRLDDEAHPASHSAVWLVFYTLNTFYTLNSVCSHFKTGYCLETSNCALSYEMTTRIFSMFPTITLRGSNNYPGFSSLKSVSNT